MKTAKECATFLRQYNRWRRGRGKKYATPGIPFSVIELCETIDRVIDILNAIPKEEDLATVRLVDGVKNKKNSSHIRRINKFMSVLKSNEQT